MNPTHDKATYRSSDSNPSKRLREEYPKDCPSCGLWLTAASLDCPRCFTRLPSPDSIEEITAGLNLRFPIEFTDWLDEQHPEKPC